MDSLRQIKYACLKTICIFYSIVRNQYQKDISKTILFIPQIIDSDTSLNRYVNNKKPHIPLFLRTRHLYSLDKLVEVIYKKQDDISWVDFQLCYIDSSVSIFIVELVCLNKREESIKYHLCWSECLLTKPPQNAPLLVKILSIFFSFHG